MKLIFPLSGKCFENYETKTLPLSVHVLPCIISVVGNVVEEEAFPSEQSHPASDLFLGGDC